MTDERLNSGTGKRSGNGWIVLVLFALILPGVVYLSFQKTDSPAKLSSLPAPSKPVQARDEQGRLLPPPSFDAVSADEDGMVFAAGKGPAGWDILLQNATRTLGETKATGDGEWLLTLERPLEPGDYVLSLLAQGPPGQPILAGKHTFALTVASRRKSVPSPSRQIAAPSSAVAQAQPAARPEAAKITKVKPGDSLWMLAHRHLGSGNRYPEIFNANKSQIKNPDLIYPDQQFAMPH
jgi:nucleoid-associated protein YgaU